MLLASAACDVPTSAPIIQQRWIVPAQTSRITVASLLPSGVSILPDSSGFTLTAGSSNVTRQLSDDCTQCTVNNGLMGIKPAMTVTASTSSVLAADIASATLTGGSIALNITNNYTFDPLRPNGNAAPYGTATITVSNGSTVLGSVEINGATQSLVANGGVLNVNVPLSGVVSGATPVSVMMSVVSPEGTPVAMDASRTIAVVATPVNLKVARANVSLAGRTLSSSSTFDLGNIDDAIIKRIEGGALQLNVDNPFILTSALTVRLQPDGGAAITKQVTLDVGATSPSIAFTKDELHALVGHKVTVTMSGSASSPTGTVSVQPKQAVAVVSHFDITLSVGGSAQ